MKVIVTGGTGFIGAATASELSRRGHDVIAVGRTPPALRRAEDQCIAFVGLDLGDGAGVNRLLDGHEPDAIVHLAWYTEPSSYLTNRPENMSSLSASLQLLAAAERIGCPRVVMGGTCLEDAVGTSTVYARTKRAMHEAASEYFEADRPRVTCAHIFSVYGPGEPPERAVPSIIRALLAGDAISLTDARPLRDYLHVQDIASALATIAESTSGGQIDICSGASRPLHQVFSLLGELLDGESLLRFGALPSSSITSFDVQGDPTRIRALGWSPRFTLEAGLRATIESWTNSTAHDVHREQ